MGIYWRCRTVQYYLETRKAPFRVSKRVNPPFIPVPQACHPRKRALSLKQGQLARASGITRTLSHTRQTTLDQRSAVLTAIELHTAAQRYNQERRGTCAANGCKSVCVVGVETDKNGGETVTNSNGRRLTHSVVDQNTRQQSMILRTDHTRSSRP
jgi:hypothetical protein